MKKENVTMRPFVTLNQKLNRFKNFISHPNSSKSLGKTLLILMWRAHTFSICYDLRIISIFSMTEFRTPRKLKPNGGWKDERDIELCKLFRKTTRPKDLEVFRLGILEKMTKNDK